jgi:hypothetical protein
MGTGLRREECCGDLSDRWQGELPPSWDGEEVTDFGWVGAQKVRK